MVLSIVDQHVADRRGSLQQDVLAAEKALDDHAWLNASSGKAAGVAAQRTSHNSP